MTTNCDLGVFLTLLVIASFHNSQSRPRSFKSHNITSIHETWNTTQQAETSLDYYITPQNITVSPQVKNATRMEASDVLRKLLENYDRRVRPMLEVQPVTVYVNMFVSSMEGFQELTMDFSMTIYFRQWWQDPRLAYNNLYRKESITVGGDILNQIWLPDTHFEYEKSAQDRTRDQTFLLKLFRNGTVMWSRSDSVKTSCAMNLRSFPMDTQRCNFSIESFGYSIHDVIYKWRSKETQKAIQLKKNLALSKFILWKINKYDKVSHYDTGSFSGIVAEFTLTRRTLYYIMQIYLPCAMIVFLSWVSFWIDSDSTPARISLGITTVLSMTTLLFGVQSSLPKVPYVKSLDVYMFVSFTLVFASLIEYACVHYYITKKEAALAMKSLAQRENGIQHMSEKKKPEEKDFLSRMKSKSFNFAKDRRDTRPSRPSTESSFLPGAHLSPLVRKGLRVRIGPKVNMVDRYSRMLFPLFFLVFNIIYWPLYLL